MLRLGRSWLSVALAFSFGPVVSNLNAQTTFELSPLFGYYAPTAQFAPSSIQSTTLPQHPSDLRGVAWGVQASLKFNRQFGVEVLAAVANSMIVGNSVIYTTAAAADASNEYASAQVLVVTAQARYELLPSSERTRLWLSAGPGLVRRGGMAYSENGVGAPVSVGTALGAGMEVPITRHLRATAGFQLLLYQLDVKVPPNLIKVPGEFESGFQRDLLPHLGLAWRW
jgi:hypothetical protein